MNIAIYALAGVGALFILMIVIGFFVRRAAAKWDRDYILLRESYAACASVLENKENSLPPSAANARESVLEIFYGRDVTADEASNPDALGVVLSVIQQSDSRVLPIIQRELQKLTIAADKPDSREASFIWRAASLAVNCEILARRTKQRMNFVMANGLQTKALLLIWPNQWMLPERM